jgi:hypothetical protein
VKIEDLKEVVAELMEQWSVGGHGVVDTVQDTLDMADDLYDANRNKGFYLKLSKKEKEVIKMVAHAAHSGRAEGKTFSEIVAVVARHVGADLGDWPDRAKPWRGDIKFEEKPAINYVCAVVTNGGDGHAIKLSGPGECPNSWGADASRADMGSADVSTSRDANWWSTLDKMEGKVLTRIKAKLLNDEYTGRIEFERAVEQSATELGIEVSSLNFMSTPQTIRKAKEEFIMSLPRSERREVSEAKDKKKKKRGFGEGEPPEEEIYKKREVVQEADLEAPDAAQEMGDAATAQGEAGEGLADAQTQAAEAAGERKEASSAWKEAGKLKIAAVDAAEKHAEKEGKATDAAEKAVSAAQDATQAAKVAAAEKQKALDVAKKAYEQEKEAAEAVQAAAETEQAALDAMSKGQEEMSTATTEFGETAPEFGETLASDEETRAEEETEREEEREEREAEGEERKADDEAAADTANAEREAADEEAAAGAEADEEEEEPEEEEEEEELPPVTESTMYILKSMIRKEHQALTERKWGDKGGAKAPVEQKLQDAGITADELRGMVLKTVMAGEEERDKAMIKVLNQMLQSLQSIEYSLTPTKGPLSQLAQKGAHGWVNESLQNGYMKRSHKLITEMRGIGMSMEADLHESFLKWLLECGEVPYANVEGAVEDEIADLKTILIRMGEEQKEKYALDKQMAEVPGHHN